MSRGIRVLAGLLCAAVLALSLYLEMTPGYAMTAVPKLLLAGSFALLWTMAFPPGRSRRLWLTGLLLYYLWMLSNVLFFDASYGRTGERGTVNLEPLATIRLYLALYRRGRRGIALLNLAGNLAAFMPFGFFLPALWRRQGNLLLFLPTMTVLIGAVEVAQVVTACGSGDIDDLILNLAGALAAWLVLWPLSRYLNNRLKGGKP